MKNLKKCLAIIAVSAIIGGGVYVIPNEIKACSKCVIDDNRGVRKCGKCGGFLRSVSGSTVYRDGYLYVTYECKNCKHRTTTKTKQ